ncbi:helix-turn-helix domain-containing protein [Actinokineospora sp. HUAS TT18]|uniref:helix-turn-helix domain-containing protein n=1 Tax=Actinokineospora sp. HUAS TT18 TaxID=3447451 RepID=UPI003F51D60C
MTGNRRPARMRALGMELAAARVRAGKTTVQAARGIGTSPATVNRTEKANRVSLPTDVASLLTLYGITGPARHRIMDLAENLDAREWLETVDRPRRLLPTLIGFESSARTVVDFDNAVIPGLLQTPAYLRGLLTVAGVLGSEQEPYVDARIDRQRVLAKLAGPQYTAIIDEAILRRPCGGSEVMVQQINWLIGRAQLPHINIHVIPARHGMYPNWGPYRWMGFAGEPAVVYVENSGVAGFIDAPDQVAGFECRTAALMRVALGAADTVNFLTRLMADYERS